jgi:hypothetical protein
MSDRIETIYGAIDQMAKTHGKTKPKKWQCKGGKCRKWNFDEEIKIWKKQVIEREEIIGVEPLTSLQWKIIDSYINTKRKELGLRKVI